MAVTKYESDHTAHDVLLMHGASSDQLRVKPLAEALAHRGCRVVTFDFTGGGRSSGTISELSLQKRYEEASAMLAACQLQHNLILAGFSMSGQTCIDVAAALPESVAGLALFAPAIYSRQAYAVSFGPEFSKIIRQTDSWRQSDAVQKLHSFRGTLVTFESPHDVVIPGAILDVIHASTEQAVRCYRLSLNNTSHKMGQWMCDKPIRADWCADVMLRATDGATDFDDRQAQADGVDYALLSKS